MTSYTTKSGSTLSVDGSKLTVTTTAGKTITETLTPTTAGRNGLRIMGRITVDTDTATWIDAQYAAYRQSQEDALEAAIPGIHEMMRLDAIARNESARYRQDFSRMMDDADNDGARPPKAEDRSAAQQLKAMQATNPRAALYLQAKHQHESTHWADNTGKGHAARNAMDILRNGGSIEDATAALAVRREVVD